MKVIALRRMAGKQHPHVNGSLLLLLYSTHVPYVLEDTSGLLALQRPILNSSALLLDCQTHGGEPGWQGFGGTWGALGMPRI